MAKQITSIDNLATVDTVQGEGFVIRPDGARVPLEPRLQLRQGDVVVTEQGALATILLAQGGAVQCGRPGAQDAVAIDKTVLSFFADPQEVEQVGVKTATAVAETIIKGGKDLNEVMEATAAGAKEAQAGGQNALSAGAADDPVVLQGISTNTQGQDLNQTLQATAAGGTTEAAPTNTYVVLQPIATATTSQSFTTTITTTTVTTAPITAVTVPVIIVDQPSQLQADTVTSAEDTLATGNVLSNDSDLDSVLSVVGFSIQGVTAAAGQTLLIGNVGTMTIEANGNYTFTPVANWSGDVPQVTYTTNTGSSSTLAITLTDVNEAPTAIALSNLSITENVDTTSRVEVATITVSDDALGSETLTLGGADAAKFEIDAGKLYLKAGQVVNFEGQASYAVTVTATDDADATLTKTQAFTLSVTDVNEAPTAIALSNLSITENVDTTSRVEVATITVSDDALGSETLTLGGADAAKFEIDAGKLYLKAGQVVNFEGQASYAVTVTATDDADATLTKTQAFTLSVTDVNEAPTAIALSNLSITENVDTTSRVEVATITVSDDALGSETLTLGGADAAKFEIDAGKLYLKAGQVVNFEGQASYAVTVTATDDADATLTKTQAFTLSVTDVNEAPTAIALSNLSITENVDTTSRVEVATITVSDDALGSETLTLGGADAAKFEIDAGKLYLKAGQVVNFEGQASYAVTVTATDDADATLTKTQAFTLSVTDVNEAPTAIALSNLSITENVDTTSRVEVATITVSDDALGSETLTLGGADAAKFEIDAGKLYLKAGQVVNFEGQASYAVTVTATDDADATLTKTQAFTLSVTDVNEAPTAIALSNLSITENVDTTSRVEVATITVSDDALGSETLTLGGADAAKFEIDAGKLYLKAGQVVNFEGQASYAVTVTATDDADATLTKTQAFTLSVTDVNEAPTAIALSNLSITENVDTTSRVEVATITVSDDALGSETLTLGGADAAKFEIDAGKLYLKAGQVVNFEGQASYAVTVTATDDADATLTKTQAFTLSVTDVNEAPTAIALSNLSITENVDTTSRVEVATITVSDDALGSETLTLGGADAAKFEIDAGKLYLKAGQVVNFEGQASYAVTVTATDDADATLTKTQAFTLSVTDVNEAPTAIALSNLSITENVDTTSRVEVATITVSDDALGSETLTLGGADAAKFEIDAGKLYLKAGQVVNFEGQASYAVTVTATDDADATLTKTQAFTLSVTDVNEAPTAIALSNTVSSLAENTDTTSRVKVADIGITDDALGSETITLTGADADSFEVVGNALYLKAGTALNYEGGKTSYAVTVSVADATLTGSTPVTADYSLTVTDTTAPTLTVTQTDSTIATDGVINSSERTAGVQLSGTTEANRSVTISTGTGSATTVTADASGNWSATVPTASLPSSGNVTFTVTSSDAAGNTATVTRTVTVDTTAPTLTVTQTDSTIATDGVINSSERTAGVQLSGTTEANRSVTISTGTGSATTVTADASGNWSATVPTASLPSSGNVTFTVTSSDAAGNTATVTRTVTVDTTAPTLTVTQTDSTIATDGVINSSERTAGVQLSGTTEANRSVTISTGTGSATTVTADASGNWSATVPTASLPSSGNVTFTVTSSDGAGNTATVTRTVTVDTTAPTLTVTQTDSTIATDGVINSSERTAGVQLSGTTEANRSVTISTGTGSATTVTADASGNWSATVPTASLPSSGNVTFTVTSSDAAGNTATVTRTATVEAAPITGTVNADTLQGGAGNDSIFGLAANDIIDAGAGDDLIVGGTGADTLTGSAGRDTFQFAAGDSQATLSGSSPSFSINEFDVITDFNSSNTRDVLDLPSALPPSSTARVDGTDSVLFQDTGNNFNDRIGAHQVSSTGLVTFYDAKSGANPSIVTIDTTAKLAAAVDYLVKNDLGAAGTTVAFKYVVNAATSQFDTFVYSQTAEVQGGGYTLVRLTGVDAVGLTTDPTLTTQNYILIS